MLSSSTRYWQERISAVGIVCSGLSAFILMGSRGDYGHCHQPGYEHREVKLANTSFGDGKGARDLMCWHNISLADRTLGYEARVAPTSNGR
jgi:hypothetical protein